MRGGNTGAAFDPATVGSRVNVGNMNCQGGAWVNIVAAFDPATVGSRVKVCTMKCQGGGVRGVNIGDAFDPATVGSRVKVDIQNTIQTLTLLALVAGSKSKSVLLCRPRHGVQSRWLHRVAMHNSMKPATLDNMAGSTQQNRFRF